MSLVDAHICLDAKMYSHEILTIGALMSHFNNTGAALDHPTKDADSSKHFLRVRVMTRQVISGAQMLE